MAVMVEERRPNRFSCDSASQIFSLGKTISKLLFGRVKEGVVCRSES